MSTLAPWQLLRRHVVPFAISFLSLTAVLVTNYAMKRAATGGLTVETVLFAVPFTAALTIPMAVLLAVLVVFARLRKEGVLETARLERGGIRRLVAPVLGAATVLAAFTFVLNSQIVPRANERLATLSAGPTHERGDRELTIGELQSAAGRARASTTSDAPALATMYEVEIQKKYAIAAASLVLALTGVAIVLLVSRGGLVLLTIAGYTVFGVYYAALVVGETLADRLILSPFTAMWMANALLLAFALLVLWWRSRAPSTPHRDESFAVGT